MKLIYLNNFKAAKQVTRPILKKIEGGRGKEERLLLEWICKKYQLVECRGAMPSQNSRMPSGVKIDPQFVQPLLPEN